MSNETKDYQEIIDTVDSLKDKCTTESELLIICEALDVISDYEKVTDDLNRMIKYYETSEKPMRIGEGIYICPVCRKRTRYNHTHCHYCGKKLGWNK